MGNTCYLNAVLQALAGCDVLREYFCAMDPQQRPSSHRGVLLESLRQLIVRLAGEPDAVAPGATAVAPRALLAAFHRVNPMFEDFGQHVRTEMGALCPTLTLLPAKDDFKETPRLHVQCTLYSKSTLTRVVPGGRARRVSSIITLDHTITHPCRISILLTPQPGRPRGCAHHPRCRPRGIQTSDEAEHAEHAEHAEQHVEAVRRGRLRWRQWRRWWRWWRRRRASEAASARARGGRPPA